jgi:uncharacterized protein
MDETPNPLSQDDKNMAMLSHLLTFAGYVIPFGNILGPLVVYLTKKDQSDYIRHHSAEALNFQVSIMIYVIISVILILVLVGFFLLMAVAIVNVVFTIVAAVKASEGVYYRYPLAIRFIQ